MQNPLTFQALLELPQRAQVRMRVVGQEGYVHLGSDLYVGLTESEKAESTVFRLFHKARAPYIDSVQGLRAFNDNFCIMWLKWWAVQKTHSRGFGEWESFRLHPCKLQYIAAENGLTQADCTNILISSSQTYRLQDCGTSHTAENPWNQCQVPFCLPPAKGSWLKHRSPAFLFTHQYHKAARFNFYLAANPRYYPPALLHTHTFPDGGRYEGMMEDGRMHGQGIYHYPNGWQRWEGTFDRNRANGKGICYNRDGQRELHFEQGRANLKQMALLTATSTEYPEPLSHRNANSSSFLSFDGFGGTGNLSTTTSPAVSRVQSGSNILSTSQSGSIVAVSPKQSSANAVGDTGRSSRTQHALQYLEHSLKVPKDVQYRPKLSAQIRLQAGLKSGEVVHLHYPNGRSGPALLLTQLRLIALHAGEPQTAWRHSIQSVKYQDAAVFGWTQLHMQLHRRGGSVKRSFKVYSSDVASYLFYVVMQDAKDNLDHAKRRAAAKVQALVSPPSPTPTSSPIKQRPTAKPSTDGSFQLPAPNSIALSSVSEAVVPARRRKGHGKAGSSTRNNNKMHHTCLDDVRKHKLAILAIVDDMRTGFGKHPGIKICDRAWGLRTYKRCFVGEAAVTYFVNYARYKCIYKRTQQTALDIDYSSTTVKGWSSPGEKVNGMVRTLSMVESLYKLAPVTRKDATEFFVFLQERGMLDHVAKGHRFKDAHLFYRFHMDDSSDEAVRRERSWSLTVLNRESHRDSLAVDDEELQPETRREVYKGRDDETTLERSPLVVSIQLLYGMINALRQIPQVCAAGFVLTSANSVHVRASHRYQAARDDSAALRLIVKDKDIIALKPIDKMLFFINVYNLLALHAAVHFFGRGTEDSSLHLAVSRYGSYEIGDNRLRYSLLDLEYRVLRNGLVSERGANVAPDDVLTLGLRSLMRGHFPSEDPRANMACDGWNKIMNFVLSSGARSAPRLRVMRPDNYQETLDESASDYVLDHAIFEIRRARGSRKNSLSARRHSHQSPSKPQSRAHRSSSPRPPPATGPGDDEDEDGEHILYDGHADWLYRQEEMTCVLPKMMKWTLAEFGGGAKLLRWIRTLVPLAVHLRLLHYEEGNKGKVIFHYTDYDWSLHHDISHYNGGPPSRSRRDRGRGYDQAGFGMWSCRAEADKERKWASDITTRAELQALLALACDQHTPHRQHRHHRLSLPLSSPRAPRSGAYTPSPPAADDASVSPLTQAIAQSPSLPLAASPLLCPSPLPPSSPSPPPSLPSSSSPLPLPLPSPSPSPLPSTSTSPRTSAVHTAGDVLHEKIAQSGQVVGLDNATPTDVAELERRVEHGSDQGADSFEQCAAPPTHHTAEHTYSTDQTPSPEAHNAGVHALDDVTDPEPNAAGTALNTTHTIAPHSTHTPLQPTDAGRGSPSITAVNHRDQHSKDLASDSSIPPAADVISISPATPVSSHHPRGETTPALQRIVPQADFSLSASLSPSSSLQSAPLPPPLVRLVQRFARYFKAKYRVEAVRVSDPTHPGLVPLFDFQARLLDTLCSWGLREEAGDVFKVQQQVLCELECTLFTLVGPTLLAWYNKKYCKEDTQLHLQRQKYRDAITLETLELREEFIFPPPDEDQTSDYPILENRTTGYWKVIRLLNSLGRRGQAIAPSSTTPFLEELLKAPGALATAFYEGQSHDRTRAQPSGRLNFSCDDALMVFTYCLSQTDSGLTGVLALLNFLAHSLEAACTVFSKRPYPSAKEWYEDLAAGGGSFSNTTLQGAATIVMCWTDKGIPTQLDFPD